MKLIFFIFSLLFFSQLNAEENSIEYKIKAGYLYNFTKFITWPDDELESFNLCILGKDPFGPIINPIEKRSVKGKPIRLSRIKKTDEAKHCHIVYISILSKAHISKLGTLTIRSVPAKLTVGDTKEFGRQGGMISFFQREGKVKLHINLPSLRKTGLEISAKLLEVAEIYEGKPND